MSLFQKTVINSIKQNEIFLVRDAMVYALYGLNEDEIAIVEGR
ncbi:MULTISPECIES: hypothetical protein [unclassified Sulfuricurvum]|nr:MULTISPECIES: hypothetical protein [unclassified Sulfuricurvum]